MNCKIGVSTVIDPTKIGLDVAAIITIISGSSQYYKEVTLAAEETPEVVNVLVPLVMGLIPVVNTKILIGRVVRKIQSW